MATWHRPSWRKLKTNQEYNLAINPEELVSQRLTYRQPVNSYDAEGQNTTLDEGCLDLTIVKEITIGSRHPEYDAELLATGRRYGLTHLECCISILYGHSLNDNRVLCLLCSPMLCRLWYVGLNWIIKGIKRQQKLADRSMLWLKEQYIQLYFEDSGCCEPLAADAIRVFGGRDWANTGITPNTTTPVENADTFKREASIKFKKKRSVVNLLSQATTSSTIPESECSKDRDSKTKQLDRKKDRTESSDHLWQNIKNFRVGSITYETQLDFLDFIALFRSFRYKLLGEISFSVGDTNFISNFSLLARKDLRDLFDQLSVTRKSKTRLNSEKSRSAPELCASIPGQRKIGKIIE